MRCVLLLVLAVSLTASAFAKDVSSLAKAETLYADLNDAIAAVATIDSGYVSSFGGKDRAQWQEVIDARKKQLQNALRKFSIKQLSKEDARAVSLMRAAVAALTDTSSKSDLHCADSQKADLTFHHLSQALYACFEEVGNHLELEGKPLTRGGAFGRMESANDPAARKAAFLALSPLYKAINADNQNTSPYRRLVTLAAADYAKRSVSELTNAARTIGVSSAEVEKWLEQILDVWRQVTPDTPIEPWDYRYLAGAAGRQLDSVVSREALGEINARYYRDLGADLEQLGVIYDLDPRRGKSPVAYTDFARRGRDVNKHWQPTIARVLASYSSGGLGNLNEYIHENGHAVQISAIHTRPAFMDWGDTVFVEAFADVPSWNTYDVAWQKKYLGQSASESDNLRALYAGVMLDVAWSLFEIRMLRTPTQDPNKLWTDITSRYLHIVPHPELSWWAVRGQLVDAPGYMINYGLGAIITADIRQRVREQLGAFATGNEEWYPWLMEHLLRFGTARETSELLRDFLQRPVSPAALLTDVQRMSTSPAGHSSSGQAQHFRNPLTTSH